MKRRTSFQLTVCEMLPTWPMAPAGDKLLPPPLLHCGRQAVQYRRAGHRCVREEGLSTVARHLPDGNYSLRSKLQVIPRILENQSFSNLIKFI